MSKVRFFLSAVATIFMLSSCGPIYRTQYTYLPPESAAGKTCTFQCENSKLQCEQIADLSHDRCVDRAERNYDRCLDREEKANKCYKSYCSGPNYDRCEAKYRSCYQACGGTVTSQQVCVSFCDQAG